MRIPLNLSLLLPLGKAGLIIQKPVTPERIRENAGVFDFGLPREDVKALAGLTGIAGTSARPDETDF